MAGSGEQDSIKSKPVYALGADAAERQRLRRQSEELRAHSTALLDHIGIQPGWRAIDLGCGPMGVLDLLSERVGPGGHVIGFDLNPANLTLARELVRDRRLGNVEIIEGDARHTGLPSSSFEMAHERTLLINVPRPEEVVAEMARVVRPGGFVALMDPDTSVGLCHPPLEAWVRLHALFVDSYRMDGADPFIGRRLTELLRLAGLVDIGVEARADVYPIGHSRRMIRADLVRSIRSKLVERGLATELELDELDRAVRAHLADPNTLVAHLYFFAWGRKP